MGSTLLFSRRVDAHPDAGQKVMQLDSGTSMLVTVELGSCKNATGTQQHSSFLGRNKKTAAMGLRGNTQIAQCKGQQEESRMVNTLLDSLVLKPAVCQYFGSSCESPIATVTVGGGRASAGRAVCQYFGGTSKSHSATVTVGGGRASAGRIWNTCLETRMPSAMSSWGVTQMASQDFSSRCSTLLSLPRRGLIALRGRMNMTRPGGYIGMALGREDSCFWYLLVGISPPVRC